jgi:distribution and morphology protein 34
VEEERTGDVSDDDFDNEDLDIDLEVDHDTLSPLQVSSPRLEDSVEWETFPAVGGGVISRPRVYHSQSKIRAPSESGAMPSPGGTGSITARASSIGASSTIGVSPPSFIQIKLIKIRA